MTDEVWNEVAILRHCRRCLEWLPLARFRDNELLCDRCWYQRYALPVNHHVLTRATVLTDKGRAFLAAERHVA